MGNTSTTLLSEEEKNLIQKQWGNELEKYLQDGLEVFRKLDFTNDGQLNREEFSKSLGILGVNNSKLCTFLFDAIDLDTSGTITFYEFINFMLTLIRPDVEPKLGFAFRLIDLDKNGTITQAEIRTMVETFYYILTDLQLKSGEVDQFVERFCKGMSFGSSGTITREAWLKNSHENIAFVKSLGLAGKKKKGKEEDKASLRLGKAIFFGQVGWNFMLTVMLGIQTAVEKSTYIESKKFVASTFTDKESHELNQTTKITAYAPQIFRSIRHHCRISEEQFTVSLGIRSVLGSLMLGDLGTLSSLISEGKSGSFFYWSSDAQFMVKTISSAEKQTFEKIIPDYYHHMRNNPNTLLTRMFGLYKLNSSNQELRFVVLGNVFNTTKSIDYRFDLKGSTVGRTVGDENLNKKGMVFKDLDWIKMKRKINIAPKYVGPFRRQLESDVAFLAKNNIIDYSLLVGVHKTDTTVQSERERWQKENEPDLKRAFEALKKSTETTPGRLFDQLDIATFSKVAYKHSSSSVENDADEEIKITSRSVFQKDSGGMKSYRVDEDSTEIMGEEIFFVGIIDTLIAYEWRKQSEHALKSVLHDGGQISVIPPPDYSERFLKFVSASIEDTESQRANRVRSSTSSVNSVSSVSSVGTLSAKTHKGHHRRSSKGDRKEK